MLWSASTASSDGQALGAYKAWACLSNIKSHPTCLAPYDTHGRSCCKTYTHIHKDAATAAYTAHQQEAERALAACRAYAAAAREARFPTPQVLEVQVGGCWTGGCGDVHSSLRLVHIF